MFRFFYHIGSVAYWKCTGVPEGVGSMPGVETMAPAAPLLLFLIEPNTLPGHSRV